MTNHIQHLICSSFFNVIYYQSFIFLYVLFLSGNYVSTGAFLPVARAASVYSQTSPDANDKSQAVKAIINLEYGKPVTRQLSAEETHRYQIKLGVDQYMRLVAYKQGIYLELRLSDPDKKMVIISDSPNGSYGQEKIVLIARMGGDYTLEVKCPEVNVIPGSYRVVIEELREPTQEDRRRFIAQSKYMEAALLAMRKTKDALEAAIGKYKESIQLFRAVNDLQGEAYAETQIGSLFLQARDPRQAIEHYSQALSLAPSLKELDWEAFTYNQIGQAYNSLGDHANELKSYDQALPLWDKTKDLDGKAIILGNMGWALNSLGQKPQAVERFKQALSIRQGLSDYAGQTYLLTALGAVHDSMGQRELAKNYFKQALPLFHDLRDYRGEASTLTFLGRIHHDLGESRQALEYFNQALLLRRDKSDERGEGYTLGNLAKVYSALGEKQQAFNTYYEALRLFKKAGDAEAEASALNNIGLIYFSLGNNQSAIEKYEEAIALAQKIRKPVPEAYIRVNLGRALASAEEKKQLALGMFKHALETFEAMDDRKGKTEALISLGQIHHDLKDTKQALAFYEQAIGIVRSAKEPKNEATILGYMGAVFNSLGDYKKALDHYNQALKISRDIGYPSLEANALYYIASIKLSLGNTDEARDLIENAIRIAESLRTKIDVQDLRASYLASVQDYYKLDIDILMKLHKQDRAKGFDVAAFQVSEQSRARALLDLLTESQAEVYRDIDPELIKRKRDLQEKINSLASLQMRLPSAGDQERKSDLNKRLTQLRNEYQQLEAQIRASSIQYASLTELLTPEQIQRQVLDSKTMILEYAFGDARSYLWAITSTAIESFELAGRKEIEEAAKRLYDLLTARSKTRKFETSQERSVRIADADKQYPEAARILSRMILGPVGTRLGEKRLLIIPDGALQLVPFAALPVPDGRTAPMAIRKTNSESRPTPGDADFIPLIAEHEIACLPSASALAILRREKTAKVGPAQKLLAIFADPVFSKDDPRLDKTKMKPSQPERNLIQTHRNSADPESEIERTAKESGVLESGLTRLPYTRDEAKAILALVAEKDRKEALDFDANRALATSEELRQYRFLHFATHGFLNSLHPELSGLALSLVDRNGVQQDGFLRIIDVFNLKISADLVTLSACQTGLGKQIRGEGLIGLTRAFMYAGTSRVLVSLCNVNDRATAEMMRLFYSGILGKQRLRPAAALRQAQLSMRQDKRWHAPYYWAVFVLQGEIQ